jgi:hypothetical protein
VSNCLSALQVFTVSTPPSGIVPPTSMRKTLPGQDWTHVMLFGVKLELVKV